MPESKDSLLENIWDFILGSLRLIFFIVLFTLTLISITVTIFVNLSLYYGHSHIVELLIINAILIVPLTALLLGTHGFFYKNVTTLHWFSIILFVSAALTLISGITVFILTETLNHSQVEDQFRIAQKSYSWLTKPTDLNSNAYIDSTFWDGLQSLFGCCGIEGPDDWSAFAPKSNGSNASVYPKSCCGSRADIEVPGAHWNLCSKEAVNLTGCRDSLKFSWKTVSIVMVFIAVLYTITAGIAMLIIRETQQEEAEVRTDAVNEALGEPISLSHY